MTIKDTQPKEKKSTKKTSVKEKSVLKDLGARMEQRSRMKNLLRKDIEVEIMNNTNGKLFYKCPKTHQIIEMQGYGDMEVLTIEQLNAMKNSHRNMLENFWIVIVDVYDDEVEIDDVLAYLRLDKLYKGIKFDSEILDGLVRETDLEEFKAIILDIQPSLVVRIAERMKVLSEAGSFGDMYKMRFISELMGQPDLFTEDR